MQIYGLNGIGQVADIPGAVTSGQNYKLQKDAIDEKKRLENTTWLAGAANYALQNWDSEERESILSQLEAEGKRRGILDPQSSLRGVPKGAVIKVYQGARTALGGVDEKLLQPQQKQVGTHPTAPMQNYQERQRLVEAYGPDSEQVKTFDRYVRAGRVTDIGGVPTEIGAAGPNPLSTLDAEVDAAALEAQRVAQAKAQGGVDVQGTSAQQAVDQAYAKEYVTWTQGGASDVVRNLAQLGGIRDRLAAGEKLTGKAVGMTPGPVRTYTDPEAQNALEQVEEVVQRNLRIILGAQFTENEGKRLIERAYNPAMEPEINARRLTLLMTMMDQGINQRTSAAKYYEKNGTLRGWEGQLPSVADFDAALDQLDAQMGVGQRSQTSELNVAEELRLARDAIRRGAPVESVKKKLRQRGIDPELLE